MSRPTYAVLATEHLRHNALVIRQQISKDVVLMAVVKANAYGHGLRSVSKRLIDLVDKFGVASIDEALILRSVGIVKPIVLMEGIFDKAELAIAAENAFEIVLHNKEQVRWLLEAQLPVLMNVWLKIDTGMGRLGFTRYEAQDVYSALSEHGSSIQRIGIMSHFSMAEVPTAFATKQQKIDCHELMALYKGPHTFVNSAGIFALKDLHADMVRAGIALYGVSPFSDVSGQDLGLKPVMTLKSTIIAVKTLPKGHAVGYAGVFVCPEKMPIGIVAVGYGDGYPRSAQNGTPVLVNNVECPLVGNVSMDMLAVDLRPLSKEASIGDEVILWGEQLSVERVAQHASTIPYEILTRVQQRVPFTWI